MAIPEESKKELYAYMYGILRNNKCYTLRINGIANHVHLLVDVHPTVAVANLVKELKQWSSHWMKQNPRFPDFDGWGDGYYAFSIGIDGLSACKDYIIGQEKHYLKCDTLEEVKEIARLNGVAWNDADWD